jgi:proteic killer suppression protein
MIKSIKHKGLRKFYETGSSGGIRPDHAQRLRLRLTKLDAIASLDDITLKSWGLHQLKGDKAGQWAI